MKKAGLLLYCLLLFGCSTNQSSLDSTMHKVLEKYGQSHSSEDYDPFVVSYLDKSTQSGIRSALELFFQAYQNLDLEEMSSCLLSQSSAGTLVQEYETILEESKAALEAKDASENEKEQVQQAIDSLQEVMKLAAQKTVEHYEIEEITAEGKTASARVSITGIGANAENNKVLSETMKSSIQENGITPDSLLKACDQLRSLLQSGSLITGTS